MRSMKKTTTQVAEPAMISYEQSFASKDDSKTIFPEDVRWTGLCIGIGLGVLVLDLAFLDELTVGILYAGVVLFASRLSYSYSAYAAAAICSGLSLLSPEVSDSATGAAGELGNRALVIFGIWVIAFLSLLWDKPQLGDYVSWSWPWRGISPSKTQSDEVSERREQRGVTSLEKGGDLSELNRALLNNNQEMETLINVVSHDLRSPLVNIQGFSKELSDSCSRLRELINQDGVMNDQIADASKLLDEEIPEALHYIRAGADKINCVLSGILRFSRLGRISLNTERLNVNTMVSNIATVMEFQLKEKGVLLQIDDLPDCMGDEILVSQVFSNLIENAYKYLDPTRAGVIRISGKIKDEMSIYAVEDNGIGIQEEYQGKIFEMFHRLDPQEGAGEGLGLTIVRRIVERHQGEVSVESEAGCGTTFFLSLPCAAAVLKEGRV